MTCVCVTLAKREVGKQSLAAAGIAVNGHVGEHYGKGFKVDRSWKGSQAELTLTLKDKPFWAPTSLNNPMNLIKKLLGSISAYFRSGKAAAEAQLALRLASRYPKASSPLI